MLFQGGDHGGLEDRLWLAEKTETTRWTNKPPTSIPNATAQTQRQRQRPRSPHPVPEPSANSLGVHSRRKTQKRHIGK